MLEWSILYLSITILPDSLQFSDRLESSAWFQMVPSFDRLSIRFGSTFVLGICAWSGWRENLEESTGFPSENNDFPVENHGFP